MNPSPVVIRYFVDQVIKRCQNNLDTLLCEGRVDLSIPFVVLTYDCRINVVEHPDSKQVHIGEIGLDGDEYFVYPITRLIDNSNINQLLAQRHEELYQLKLGFVKNYIKGVLEVTYDPLMTLSSISQTIKELQLPEHMCKEFVEVAHHFSKMSFHNHTSNSRFLQNVPKLTLSIDGCIFNKPNREYYIVFGDDYHTYTVQVFKLQPNKRRDGMLYGFWVDSKVKRVYEPYAY